jgi:putative protease
MAADRIAGAIGTRRGERLKEALAFLDLRARPRPAARAELCVRIEQLRDFHVMHNDGVESVSVPVSRANMHQLPIVARKLKGKEKQILWRLPFIIFEADIPFYSEAIRFITEHGFRRFEASNLSHFQLLRQAAQLKGEADSLELVTDYRLFSLNSQALLAWQEMGVSAATLYIEDDAENMALLLKSDLPINRRVVVFCSVPAITSKIAVKGVKSDAPVLSDRGDGYSVTVRDGLTVVTPERMFSLTAFRGRLQEMGCASFVIDLAAAPRDEWQRILDAFSRGKELPGTTEFNFLMGLV